MAEINLKNIKSFLIGNLRYYYQKILELPPHLKEQYYYRLYKCKNDCLANPEMRCMKCSCPILKKALAPDSCNLERHPNLMSGTEWANYKITHNINNIEEIIKEIENDILKRRI